MKRLYPVVLADNMDEKVSVEESQLSRRSFFRVIFSDLRIVLRTFCQSFLLIVPLP